MARPASVYTIFIALRLRFGRHSGQHNDNPRTTFVVIIIIIIPHQTNTSVGGVTFFFKETPSYSSTKLQLETGTSPLGWSQNVDSDRHLFCSFFRLVVQGKFDVNPWLTFSSFNLRLLIKKNHGPKKKVER